MTVEQSHVPAPAELKAKHAKMWASGDYPSMVETFLLPLGPRLVGALPISDGTRVLDVASGTGNAALQAAALGASVVASDLTPELLDVGATRAAAAGVTLEWTVADAERLGFDAESFDVTMSCIGAMFAPMHGAVADELVRVTRPGGTIGLLSWTPEGTIGGLFAAMKPYMPPPPDGASPPPLWGSEDHVQKLFGSRVRWERLERDVLEVTAFARPQDFADHFRQSYGPTITARGRAEEQGTLKTLDAALDAHFEAQDRGGSRFEMEFLLAVGTRI